MTQACGPVFNLIPGGSTKNPLGTRIFDLGALEFYWFACSPEKTDVWIMNCGTSLKLWQFWTVESYFRVEYGHIRISPWDLN